MGWFFGIYNKPMQFIGEILAWARMTLPQTSGDDPLEQLEIERVLYHGSSGKVMEG